MHILHTLIVFCCMYIDFCIFYIHSIRSGCFCCCFISVRVHLLSGATPSMKCHTYVLHKGRILQNSHFWMDQSCFIVLLYSSTNVECVILSLYMRQENYYHHIGTMQTVYFSMWCVAPGAEVNKVSKKLIAAKAKNIPKLKIASVYGKRSNFAYSFIHSTAFAYVLVFHFRILFFGFLCWNSFLFAFV